MSVAAGNAESESRRVRYQALGRMAKEHGCSFVATAHHAGDQLETVLMRLATGSGSSGLAGIRASRPLDNSEPRLTLIRPCLGVDRAALHAICAAAGVTWAEDASNDDVSRIRARLRSGPIEAVSEALPGLERGASRSAEALADDARALHELAMSHATTRPEARGAGPVAFERQTLLACSDAVIAACLRAGVTEAAGAPVRELTRQEVHKLVWLLHSGEDDTVRPLGPVEVRIEDRCVTITRR